ncbi:polysaccharide deacetylase family protein [Prolixibacteraceae bacterium Z1-6]|uniref:Polysaccharide deacetylase family protein n=1 Tax=Draconibacterium aestuarii TaxID=2998507 RepID=A0A9X3FHF5_9BACT|nr:polysaccharide deacetylase family protein [Prolixibacteraceae bacterium Z1-6]
MKQFVSLLFLCVSLVSNAQFTWPDDKKAAVVFTYDDGLDGHLDIAVPQLDEFGFKGTFYCTGNSQSLNNRIEDWRAIAKNGHELGNHTLFHPCVGENRDWVKAEYDLTNYTLDQIVAEIQTANTLLKAIDGKTERSFAYTCGDYKAGNDDFTGNIEEIFGAARLDGPIPGTMDDFNVVKVSSWDVDEPTIEELIAYVDEARAKGTIAVFMFHSVGGGYLNVGEEQHRALLEYVNENSDDLYNDTFYNVMQYVRNNR